jgi:hypothetical protein
MQCGIIQCANNVRGTYPRGVGSKVGVGAISEPTLISWRLARADPASLAASAYSQANRNRYTAIVAEAEERGSVGSDYSTGQTPLPRDSKAANVFRQHLVMPRNPRLRRVPDDIRVRASRA